ncbi:hypothetical protein [Nocardia alba]|uniref:hypothetical protein n=1 Tax=Nocardia alba TaxID=225051 RepID=UPI001053C501|nr:hypothetical protein [Nocardia alba]
MTESGSNNLAKKLTGIDWLIALTASLTTAVVGALLLLNSWATCDVGINNGLNTAGLIVFYLPLIAATSFIAWATILRFTAGSETGPRLGGIAAAIFVSLLLIWFLFSWRHNPGGHYPAPVCPPDNVPSWWPAWIPV